jgi:PhzF family phenazine biosynthesis protein
MRPFRQVDVFSTEPLLGNPVAVVHDADGLGEEEMAAFARWTNLSETTFLLAPTVAGADYRLRIFTPGGELPFAGHPTLGSAHAWLEAGGVPQGELVVQECGAGLVALRRSSGRLAFQAPPLTRSGPVAPELRTRVVAALAVPEEAVLEVEWVANGPEWIAARFSSAEEVLALRPDLAAFDGLKIGAVGPWPDGGECAIEVRGFVPGIGVPEDPVTGSLNASVGQWLAGTVLPASYVASQGTVLGRRGRVHVDRKGDTVWVGGDTLTTIVGSVDLG